MQIDLYELLQHRQIIHPTFIKRFDGTAGEFRISIKGYPWWSLDSQNTAEGEITFIFRGVHESLIRMMDLFMLDDEALEYFDISPLEGHDWAQPSRSSIYCSSPLPDPLRLYAKVEEHLWQAEACKGARDYLNMNGGSLNRFQKITSSNSYLLAHVPDSICQIICEELERQSVPFSILSVRAPCDEGYLVRLGRSSFICREALAEFV